jgi:hypothetical protein
MQRAIRFASHTGLVMWRLREPDRRTEARIYSPGERVGVPGTILGSLRGEWVSLFGNP